ncbi:16907_t:CDS:10 [Entrophospora sp. SA101]|nr:16907_t:CDS:10 [Entrophospora sp. SA101]
MLKIRALNHCTNFQFMKHDFEAEIDGKDKVRGVVKEAKQAALDYNQAIENNYPMSERYGSSSSSANDGKKLVPDDVKYSVGANYKLDLKVTYYLFRERFRLVVESEDLDKPRAFLEYNPKTESNRLMLTLVPRFALNQIQTEVVFIVDRSGSIKGEPIKKAGQALELFVRSLPEDCYFNVVSYYEGTEIYHLIKWAFDDQLTNMTTALFLLTDGNIVKLINQDVEDNNHNNGLRIFTLGINDSVSHDLVESVARTDPQPPTKIAEALNKKDIKKLSEHNKVQQVSYNIQKFIQVIPIDHVTLTGSKIHTLAARKLIDENSFVAIDEQSKESVTQKPVVRNIPNKEIRNLGSLSLFSRPPGISKEECSFDDPMQELSDDDNNEKVKKKKVEKDAKEHKKPKIEILLKFYHFNYLMCEICYDKAKKALTKFKDYNEENDKKVMDSVRKWMNDWIKE